MDKITPIEQKLKKLKGIDNSEKEGLSYSLLHNPKFMIIFLAIASLFILFLFSNSNTGYFIFQENNVEVNRVLMCNGCNEASVPGDSEITVNVDVKLDGAVDNLSLIEYYPSAWSLINTGEGVADVGEDIDHLALKWEIGAVNKSFSRSYIIRSTSDSRESSFISKLGNELGDEQKVNVI
jgi:hypothetical protein